MLTCRFTLSGAAPSSDDLFANLAAQSIELAIARVVLEHPFLRVGLRNENARKPAFVELENINFRNHIEWKFFNPSVNYELEFVRLIKSRLDVKVESPESKPAWRILVLHIERTNFVDVMFEWGHAEIDGISVKLFHEDLLRNLNSNDKVELDWFKDRVLTIPPEKRRDLLPPLHALCKFPVTTSYALSTLWREVKPSPLVSKSVLQATWAPIRLTPYSTQYRHFSLDSNTLQNILAACRKRNTTLSGLIQALVHVSLATRLSPDEALGFLGSTVVNLRPLMSSPCVQSHNIDPKRTMANFMTVVSHEFGVELVAKIRARVADSSERENYMMAILEEFVWPAAERVRGDLQKRLDEGTRNDLMGLLKFVPDYRFLLKDWARKPRIHSAALTNLGVIDGDPSDTDSAGVQIENGKWTIDRAVFSISPEVHGAALCICPVAVKQKDLYISCDWQDGAIDIALAEGVVADLESWLQYIGRQT